MGNSVKPNKVGRADHPSFEEETPSAPERKKRHGTQARNHAHHIKQKFGVMLDTPTTPGVGNFKEEVTEVSIDFDENFPTLVQHIKSFEESVGLSDLQEEVLNYESA